MNKSLFKTALISAYQPWIDWRSNDGKGFVNFWLCLTFQFGLIRVSDVGIGEEMDHHLGGFAAVSAGVPCSLSSLKINETPLKFESSISIVQRRKGEWFSKVFCILYTWLSEILKKVVHGMIVKLVENHILKHLINMILTPIN